MLHHTFLTMIALRLVVILALSFCSTQAVFVPDTEPRAWSEYDQEHGQYSMSLLSAETSVLRYRVYVLSMEVSHTTKYTDKEIIALFTAAGTDADKITALELEFTKRGESMLSQTQRIMDAAVDMLSLSGSINQDISSSAYGKISADKTMLKNQYENFDLIYELSMDNAFISAALAKAKVMSTIGTQTGPQMTEIEALTNQAEALLLDHRKRCDDVKIYVDRAYTVGDAALAQLIATLPVN